MAGYLLTWSPNPDDDWDIDAIIRKLERGRSHVEGWSTGNSKRIQPGDHCFFMRQGSEPRGLFAWGIARSEVREEPHWDPEMRAKGRTAKFVDVQFQTLFNPARKIIPRRFLKERIKLNWDTPASGISIPDEIVPELLVYFDTFEFEYDFTVLRNGETLHPEEISVRSPGLWEGAARYVLVNAFERNPKARKTCLNHYGYACMVCGIDFEKVYGKIGKDFIHVHHLTPLSEIGEAYVVDPIADLRPVCPNCHAMLHRESPPLSIERLKSLMKKR